MRHIIYGAGAIGGAIGGYLACTGYEVLLIGQPPSNVKVINEHGLRLVTPAGNYTLKIPAVTAPDKIEYQDDDVVFLCMKAQDTEGALRDLWAVNQDIPIFCFQNGVRNEETAVRYFPRVYGVMVGIHAVCLSDGEVTAVFDPPGWFVVGRYPEGIDKLVEVIAATLRTAGFLVRISSDIMPNKWGKLMGNVANVVGAITNAKEEDVESITRAVQQEFRDILNQAGIYWVSGDELEKDWPEITAPPHGRVDAEIQNSTWQSLARKEGRVEAEFLNGEVVRLARSLGIQAPINETLLRISQEMAANFEPPGKYTPAQLSALLRLTNSRD